MTQHSDKKPTQKVDLSKVRLNDVGGVQDWELYALKMAEVLEAAMPAVRESVRVYEEKLKARARDSEGQGKG